MRHEKNKHAVALGKIGGRAKTQSKIDASKRNGKLGGRPVKRVCCNSAS
jgi:hypothetical protein